MDNDQFKCLREVPRCGSRCLDCTKVEELLSDYIDCELSSPLKDDVKLHLEACEICQEAESDLRLVKDTAKSLADYPIPPVISRRLRERLASELNFNFSEPVSHLQLVKSK